MLFPNFQLKHREPMPSRLPLSNAFQNFPAAAVTVSTQATRLGRTSGQRRCTESTEKCPAWRTRCAASVVRSSNW